MDDTQLTRRETDVIRHVIEGSGSGVSELVSQLESARVDREGVTLLRFAGHREVSAPAHVPDGTLKTYAIVSDEAGRPLGTIFVWVRGGYLSTAEYSWVTDEAPDTYPEIERIALASGEFPPR